uniref:Putative secreted protein n=1 Tax=Anopheles triannulatus TaxID=58253 RepID=A0A2M4B223_9DIPT
MKAVLSWIASGGAMIFSSRSCVATSSVSMLVAFAMDFTRGGWPPPLPPPPPPLDAPLVDPAEATPPASWAPRLIFPCGVPGTAPAAAVTAAGVRLLVPDTELLRYSGFPTGPPAVPGINWVIDGGSGPGPSVLFGAS